MYNKFLYEIVLMILLLLGLIFALLFSAVSSDSAIAQYQYAYYECDGDDYYYVKFEAPDTITKRTIATTYYSCYPLPQVVVYVPDNGKIIGFIKNSDENPIYKYQRGQ